MIVALWTYATPCEVGTVRVMPQYSDLLVLWYVAINAEIKIVKGGLVFFFFKSIVAAISIAEFHLICL